MERKKVFLIDAMALIYRSFYAMNKSPRVNSKGMNTSAAFGFCNTLLSLIKQHKPEYIAMAFDLHTPTFRHEKFPEYKANRQSTPEEIRQMEPYICKFINAMHIPIISCEGYEADDVIGTLAKQASAQGFEVFMVTPDKDYAQLVEDNIRILKLGRMGAADEVWGVEEVLAKFEIREPKQVIDILGLWGDSSDNIPGVPTIGEKKAKALLQQFDSIEEMIERSCEIESKSVRKAIEENAALALQSKFLATIVLDVPVQFSQEEFAFGQPDLALCRQLFEELEFRGFAKTFLNFFSGDKNEASQNSLFGLQPQNSLQTDLFAELENRYEDINSPHTYIYVENEQQLEDLCNSLQTKGVISVFFVQNNDRLFGLALSEEASKAWFVPFEAAKEENEKKIRLLQPIFEDINICKTGFDLKQTMHLLSDYGVCVKGNCFDILLAHYLIDSEAPHRLDLLSESLLSYRMMEAETVFGKSTKANLFGLQPFGKEQLRDLACEGADMVFRLKEKLEVKLRETGQTSLFEEIEMPLIEVLFAMESRGVRIDSGALAVFSEKLAKQKTELESRIYELAGEEFNIGSPKQLGEILFTKLQIAGDVKAKKTATKQFSTAEEVLQKYEADYPIVKAVLEWRTLAKLKNTYVDALPKMVNHATGRLHTSFNQAVTATGRLSSNNPNLQNIPIKTDLGKEIRRSFVPSSENDRTILAADYSQIELRIIASLSGDKHMCDAFRSGEDIHVTTAAKIYGIPANEVTKDQRAKVKSVNFGIIYGISAFGLSQQLSISRKEAAELINQYFETYPRIAQYIEECKQKARLLGYSQSLLGRRRYLRDINSANANLRAFAERNAVNMPVQASSADMIKRAMVEIYRRFEALGLQSKMILQVHDELVFDVAVSELDVVREIVREEMINALPLEVPVEVDARNGANWLEAH